MISGSELRGAVKALFFMAVVVVLLALGGGYLWGRSHMPPAPAEAHTTDKAAVDAEVQALAERCYDRLDALVTRYQAHLDADMADLERAARSEGSDDR
jgi:hypothetical protein